MEIFAQWPLLPVGRKPDQLHWLNQESIQCWCSYAAYCTHIFHISPQFHFSRNRILEENFVILKEILLFLKSCGNSCYVCRRNLQTKIIKKVVSYATYFFLHPCNLALLMEEWSIRGNTKIIEATGRIWSLATAYIEERRGIPSSQLLWCWILSESTFTH